MPISNKPWGSISESDYRDAAAFCKASLIDLNEPGEEKVKAKCKLPVYQPDGALNRNAVYAATAVILGARGGVDALEEERRKAARKLIRLHHELDKEPPEALLRLARG